MHIKRAAGVAAVLALVAAGAVLLARHGPGGVPWLPGCFFHQFTGLHCPGCGMTRAAHAVFHGEMAAAFRFNPLGMVLLPIALAGVTLETAGWVRGQTSPNRLGVGPRGGWIILAAVLVFWILRNVPLWPFTLLAPP